MHIKQLIDTNAESQMFNSLRINMNYSCAIRCIKSKGVFTRVLKSTIAWHLPVYESCWAFSSANKEYKQAIIKLVSTFKCVQSTFHI